MDTKIIKPPKPRYQKIELDPIFPVSSISMFTQENVDLFYCHWHGNIEIIYITEGCVDMKIDSTDYIFEKGDICIINPDEIHFGIEYQGQYTTVDLVVLSYDILNQLTSNPTYIKYIEPLAKGHFKLPTQIKSLEHESSDTPWLKPCHKMVQDLIRLGKERPLGYELNIQGKFLSLLSLFIQYDLLVDSDKHLNRGITARELDILDYIDQHFTETLSVTEIASVFELSDDYFYKLFKKATGQTPIAYILQLRIHYAKQLLRTTDLMISDIGYEVGFDSTSYFSKTFKKLSGMTPRQYRHAY